MEQNIDPVLGLLAFRASEDGKGWWTKQDHLDPMRMSDGLISTLARNPKSLTSKRTYANLRVYETS